ncbi:NAD(P)/FAD-dependent oxidoreductase [Fontibacillus sp. BL9]|uniref:NAD(P)/FAD-dependent oxidoreductase n=1 Tax=Fontibacillus sp. BL9 TaxID=3389971 RepID=UPI00397D3FEC
MVYDCIIVGGGIAGLQAAIQLGRYDCHKVLVIDAGSGRSAVCRNYRNVLGFPDGISGPDLRERGRRQAESLGIIFQQDKIMTAERTSEDGNFKLTGKDGIEYYARIMLLATGVTDRIPELPGLQALLGSTVYICPDCDGHEIQGKRTVLMGAGDTGAEMAMILIDRTKDLIYVNHESASMSAENREKLKSSGVRYESGAIAEVRGDDQTGTIEGIVMADGRIFEAERGFVAFGGNRVHSDLARQLGVRLSHNKHIETDPRSKESNVKGLFAAGDIGIHAEQVTVAMGEGSLAAIWIHKALGPCYNQ